MHCKNQSPFRLFVLCLGFVTVNLFCIHRGEASRNHKLPESGVTDTYVRSLGEKAEDFLLTKLRDPKEAHHYEGLIRQLERLARLDKDDAKTTRSLIDFVENQTQRDEVSISTLKAISEAIQFLSYRGGASGVQYVGSWLGGSRSASAHIRGDKDNLTIWWIKKSAIRGLAWSNRDDAQEIRKKLRENLPRNEEGKSILGLLDETEKEHAKVKEKGLEAAMGEWGYR